MGAAHHRGAHDGQAPGRGRHLRRAGAQEPAARGPRAGPCQGVPGDIRAGCHVPLPRLHARQRAGVRRSRGARGRRARRGARRVLPRAREPRCGPARARSTRTWCCRAGAARMHARRPSTDRSGMLPGRFFLWRLGLGLFDWLSFQHGLLAARLPVFNIYFAHLRTKGPFFCLIRARSAFDRAGLSRQSRPGASRLGR